MKINYKELEDKVYNFPTKYPEGFTQKEIEKLLEDYPNVEMSRFNDAMMGNTCRLRTDPDTEEKFIINYFCDVLTALKCGLEKRSLYGYEID